MCVCVCVQKYKFQMFIFGNIIGNLFANLNNRISQTMVLFLEYFANDREFLVKKLKIERLFLGRNQELFRWESRHGCVCVYVCVCVCQQT